jgi:monothiol glutaredoxin
MNVVEVITDQIINNDVVLYMKGTPNMPQCGFSSRVVSVLKYLNVEFKSVNVLDDPEIREGIKAFSQWPTIPQLYVKGEFIGGSDIITEMLNSGELLQLLKQHSIVS